MLSPSFKFLWLLKTSQLFPGIFAPFCLLVFLAWSAAVSGGTEVKSFSCLIFEAIQNFSLLLVYHSTYHYKMLQNVKKSELGEEAKKKRK